MLSPDIQEAWVKAEKEGKWKPDPSDPIAGCKFEKAGFRAYSFVAPDNTWKLVISDIEIGGSDSRATLTAYAENHGNAFGDLDWYVFSSPVGLRGGRNASTAIKRLERVLGGSEDDWERRLTYLAVRAERDVSARSNGVDIFQGKISLPEDTDFLFVDRVRAGRTISLFGPGSAGKTTFADALAVSADTGIEIIPGWKPTRQVRVGLLDWDEGREEAKVRLHAITNAYGVELGGYCYKRMSRPLGECADETGRWVVENRVELLIVSPVNRASRQSERDPGGPIHELYEVLREFGTTNVLIDHVVGASIKGGADREYGSVAKRDNARGSFSVYAQSEDEGQRVVVIKNTKPDALLRRMPPQAVRIEYDPPAGRNGVYDRITFHEDVVIGADTGTVSGVSQLPSTLRDSIRELLMDQRMTIPELTSALSANKGSVERVIYRYRDQWFNRLPSGKWELLPAAMNHED